MAKEHNIDFKPYETFTKSDIDGRQAFIKSICEIIWNNDNTGDVEDINKG
ncbi:hypothetical protein H0W80_03850 [Candidatus Saccharibacteria bacterium]|nr:hypothetical protein [Candidatus Saccharibacteria bacterium]